MPVPPPANLPPAGSGPGRLDHGALLQAQGNVSTVEPQTYLYYMQLRPSQPSQNIWVPYDEAGRSRRSATISSVCGRRTSSTTSRSRSATTPFSNGVVGKLVTYNMEERERVKIVNYEGTKQIDRTKIDEQLRERGIELRLDSFVDDGRDPAHRRRCCAR